LGSPLLQTADVSETGQRRGNRSMEEMKVDAARVFCKKAAAFFRFPHANSRIERMLITRNRLNHMGLVSHVH
jgi:hypothetical protein